MARSQLYPVRRLYSSVTHFDSARRECACDEGESILVTQQDLHTKLTRRPMER